MADGNGKSNGAGPGGAGPGGDFDAVIVGAGFAGLYLLHRLRGMGLSVRVIEAGGGVGGTWYWNRYPGARCDVESVQYSYQFSRELEQEWDWPERYSAQPDILKYAEHVADRFDLYRDIQFDTRVVAAHFDEAAGRWDIETDDGARFAAPFCIMATGCLSTANTPRFDGIDDFAGNRYHTGWWPHEGVDFTGQRVGVIGTGSSAIQAIPEIAEQAEHLTVFQRTPNFSVPAHNGPLDAEYKQAVKADYAALRARASRMANGMAFDFNAASALEATEEERRREFDARWAHGGTTFMGAFGDLLVDRAANETAAAYVRTKIREIVHDPAVAAMLSPHNIVGCKRLCVDTGYYKTFNRPNVTLVDVSVEPIERLTPGGLRAKGVEYEFDSIVFATGYDAMTGALLAIDIRGRDGMTLHAKWEDGPRTYLGLAMAGFPNLFTITGPGSPSVLTNMLPSIEQHVEWVADCIGYLREHGHGRIEAQTDAENAWVAHNSEVATHSLRSVCDSWYVGANVAGKPRIFMPYIGGFPFYVDKCDDVAAKGYEGFELS